MLVKLTRIRKNKFPINEFKITKMLLDALYVEYESDFTISQDSAPIYCGDKEISFPEHYAYINDFTKDQLIFRPLKNERHANILIEMFEESDMNVDFNRIEVNEYLNEKNKRRYKGSMIGINDKSISGTEISGCYSIPILKTSIIAKMVLSKKEYKEFRDLIIKYIIEQKEITSNA